MYYYSLKCIVYTPEESNICTDFFSQNIPSFDLSHLKYFENYKHPTSEKQPFLKRRTSQPIKHVPPTPIHDGEDELQTNTHHGLEGKMDFRFGPIEVTGIMTRKKKPVTTQHSLGFGILYFYRDVASLSDNETPDTKLAKDKSLNIINEEEDTVVCVVAVPSYLTKDDFLYFLGTYNASIEQYRFIRDYAPNKYTVLLKFKDRQSTVAFYQKYNGRRFNMTEPEISHVVYLKKYEIKSVTILPDSYPYLNTTVQQKEQGTYELPLCPVCLERMDESITGLSNNECHHTQECGCIQKWGKPSCPICLYSYKPNINNRDVTAAPIKAHCCFDCQSMESLWICLICGNIGCGRYQEAHAYDHYRETNHLFALEIETQHIWDYVTDGYVHRLIQQVDGGFVELPETAKQVEPTTNNKLDQISLDYSYMLTSQLDSQRIYYEEQLKQLMKSLNGLDLKMNGLQKELEMSRQEKKKLLQEGEAMDSTMTELTKEKEKLDKRIISYKDKYDATQRNLNEEKLLTKSLLVNNKLLKAEFEKKEAIVASLSRQVQELMSQLESTNQ